MRRIAEQPIRIAAAAGMLAVALAAWFACPNVLSSNSSASHAQPATGFAPQLAAAHPARAELAPGEYAVWWENHAAGGVIRAAAPETPGEPADLLWFPAEQISSVALSPDGRQAAVVAAATGDPALRVVDLRTGDGQTVDTAAFFSGVAWNRDGRLAYMRAVPAVLEVQTKDGGTEQQFGWGQELVIWDPARAQRNALAYAPPDERIDIAGWAADGRALLYVRSASTGPDSPMQLQSTGGPLRLAAASAPDLFGTPVLNASGGRMLAGAKEGLVAVSVEGSERAFIAEPAPGFSAAWAADGRDVFITVWGAETERMLLRAVDALSGEARDVREISPPGNWRLAEASPEGAWIAAYHYYSGWYLIPFAGGDVLRIPEPDAPVFFCGWLRVV